jgi:hypothetical protein
MPLIQTKVQNSSTDTKNWLRPIQFLQEEWQAYVHNIANRSAAELNQEVMPMLKRVEVSNKFGGAAGDKSMIHVVAWNAERGKDWDVLSDFVIDVDILILNEMDWGMAWSGNVHTTRMMHDELKMNYAFGVEFMELTNGNAKEINATLGMNNLVGYHGNVVMSKWQIVEIRTVCRHQLYEHLYKAKQNRMDVGERRLGGRMAFSLSLKCQMDNGCFLFLLMVMEVVRRKVYLVMPIYCVRMR